MNKNKSFLLLLLSLISIGTIAAESVSSLYILGRYGIKSENGVELTDLSPDKNDREILEENFKLFDHGDGKLSRTFFIEGAATTPYPSQSPQFIFYKALNGWNNSDCMGAGYDAFSTTPVIIINNEATEALPIIAQGEEFWSLILVDDIMGAWLKFEVDLDNMTLTISPATNGIEEIGYADDLSEEWFTLQGVKVTDPMEGIYIRVRNGKVEKILLH